MTVARLQILHTPYTVKALRGDKLAAQAVLTGFGTWHVPLRRRPVLRRDQLGLRHRTNRDEVAWRAVGTRAEALALVTILAVGGVL